MGKLKKAFEEAGVRPETGERADKKNYAERLSRSLAKTVAGALRPTFKGIFPTDSDTKHETRALGAKGPKKLDVNYSTPELGLGLGISIKTLNFKDGSSSRYTKNYTRIDHELRAEAMDYHQRQPFSVLAAIVFLPIDACDDGDTGKKRPSSFSRAVRTFRSRGQRRNHKDDPDRFEAVFVALYDWQDPDSTLFFDVEKPPPRNGRPAAPPAVSFDDCLEAISAIFRGRNVEPFEYSDS